MVFDKGACLQQSLGTPPTGKCTPLPPLRSHESWCTPALRCMNRGVLQHPDVLSRGVLQRFDVMNRGVLRHPDVMNRGVPRLSKTLMFKL